MIAKQSTVITWLLVSYVLCLPIQFQTGIGIRFAPSDGCLLFILLLGLGQLKLRSEAWSSWHFGMVIIFCVATYVSIIEYGYLSRYAFIQKDIGFLVLIVGYVVLTTYLDSWSKLRWAMKLFLMSVVLQNVFALGVYASGLELSWMNVFHPRVSGMLVDPNAYGGLLVTAFAFHIITYYSERPLIAGFLGVVSTVTLAAGILLTFSRSAWIGMAFVLLVVLVMKPVYFWRIGGVFVTALVFIVAFFGSNFTSLMVNMASRPEQIQSRIHILIDSAKMFAESPLFGIGLGVFSEREAVIIHNTPMWFLTEFGLFGFIIFLFFMAWFAYKAFRTYLLCDCTTKPYMLALLLSHAAMFGLSMGIEAFYQRHWWFVFALIAATTTVVQKNRAYTGRRVHQQRYVDPAKANMRPLYNG